ncbi:hypothetical protein TNCV_5044171 [Trichonephila clavipes]|uniref:Uncharacterized protein n=1 Tax=Trichonephila clavipes TaxID=2585209 RepID=A0A8X7BLR2_TRICX|nr:hypothetical protein TNCV_5044171 [Trichonephila clavipes]
MFDSSSYDNPTPLAHADASRDVFPRGERGTVRHCDHSSNASAESDRKETSFFCITAMQDRIAVHKHRKTEIYSGSATFLQPIFGPSGLLVIHKIEGAVKRSTFFNGCRNSGSRAQMDTQPNRIILHVP